MSAVLIVRVLGESFDLGSGERRTKAVVLSNGRQEVTVEVPDELVQAVLSLAVNGDPQAHDDGPSPVEPVAEDGRRDVPVAPKARGSDAYRDRTGAASI